MKPRVYVETSVLSYLTSLPSRDVVVAGHQQVTAEWWTRRDAFELFVSDAVIAEIRRGDVKAAQRRMGAVDGIQLLIATPEARALARDLVRAAAIPPKAAIDAAHVAIATVHGLEFLMTWNCTHIANAAMRPKIETVCRLAGLVAPIICTPEELRVPEET